MKNVICCICFIILLAGCSHNLSERISTEIKNDLNVIEKQISDVRCKLPEECKNTLGIDLNRVSDNVKQIRLKVNTLNKAFETEKDVIKQKSRKKTFVILFLIALIVLMCYNKIRGAK